MNTELIVKDLHEGLRADGKSVVECCLMWQITDKEYYTELESSEELQKAHVIGEMHCASWWHQCFRGLAKKGNASALVFGMKNVAKVGWMDKPDIKEVVEEPLQAVSISIMPPRIDDEDS